MLHVENAKLKQVKVGLRFNRGRQVKLKGNSQHNRHARTPLESGVRYSSPHLDRVLVIIV